MNLPDVMADNVTELLVRIIEFTRRRQQLLIRNIRNMDSRGYVPKDLAVKEFSVMLLLAIDEHRRNHRLLLRDSAHIKFGSNGSFTVRHIADACAGKLLENNRDEYLRVQIDKLLENSLNQRIAMELLKRQQGAEMSFQEKLN